MQFIDLKTQYEKYKSDITREINEVLDSCSFILGPKVTKLEETLANYIGVKHGIAVSSGTDALMFCLMAINIKPNDEIITTPFTFIATGEVIKLLGAKPVFVDIDPLTYNIDVKKIESAITKKTKAIMPVSLYGQCADLKTINSIANKYSLYVIEDACQSFGAETEYGKSCGISHMACTSFFPSKPLGCYGDGGMIFTNDDDLSEKLKMIHVHGQVKRYYHEILGCNGRLDALQAAILLAKFPYFEEEVKLRKQVGDYYIKGLQKIEKVTVPYIDKGNTHVYAQFSIQVPEREKVIDYLSKNGIPTAVHYPVPLHLQPVFSGECGGKGDFPIAEKVSEKIMSLPMHPFLEQNDQDKIIDIIKQALL